MVRCADNWPDLDVHVDRENTRTRDITENLRHHSTVCVLLLVYGTPGVVHTTTTHHWTPQGGFTTNVIASPWNRHRFHRNTISEPSSRRKLILGGLVPLEPLGISQAYSDTAALGKDPG